MAASERKVYIDEATGKDDASADGTEQAPFKTLLFAFIQVPPTDKPQYLVRKPATDSVSEGGTSSAPLVWTPAAKSALKKAEKLWQQDAKKRANAAQLAIREKEEADKRQLVLEAAKNIKITQDTSLPPAQKIHLDEKVKLGSSDRTANDREPGTRVRVRGHISQLRAQGVMIFITLQDGYGYLQCLLSGKLTTTYEAMTLTRQTSIEIYGEICEAPEGARVPDNRELHADYFEVIGKSPGGDDAFTNKAPPDADPQTRLDQRHLFIRGQTSSAVLKVRAAVLNAFRQTYREIRPRCLEVTPPCMVQTQVEGGATLFSFDYYGQQAYLTQSSQLYLETCLPSLGNVFCVAPSFRAEKSDTRRHLSEYTHIEAELDFIEFDDLLDHLELVMSRVIEILMADPDASKLIAQLNPKFEVPKRPFLRMKYSDAIEWLIEHDIKTDEGESHKFGDDIAEAAERKMTDIINRPIFLTHFPVEIKAFYMKRDPSDPRVTESVDCLMPGVGEIVGGSMRMDDYDELMQGYKREGIDPGPYYWYTDQRKYVMTVQSISLNLTNDWLGTVPHLMVATAWDSSDF